MEELQTKHSMTKSSMLTGSGTLMQNVYKNKMLIILILMIIGLSFASDVFLTTENLLNIVKQVSVNMILAAGVTFVIISGGIDLSVGAILAVGGVVAASIVKQDLGSPIIALMLSIIAGGILGFLNGASVSRLNVPPFIITLAMMTVARGIAYVYVDGRPIVALPKGFLTIGQGSFLAVPISIWIMLAVLVISHILLRYTIFGRYVYYIGGNEETARVSGIKVKRIKTIVYVISGVLAGLGGAILASRLNSAQPQAGMSYELDAIAAVVIGGSSLSGGVGTIPGTMIGALVIGVINNGLNLLNVSPFYQMIVKGLVIAGVVIVDMRSNQSKKA